MPATEQKVEKPRLSAEDWALGALDVIAEQGLAAVAVEPLARRLGVTKGSFYWHFPSREALLVAALERWEKTEQETVFGQMESVSDPRVRFGRIHPVVVRARILLALAAHEGQVLHARDVGDARAVQEAVRMRLLVEAQQVAGAEHQLDEAGVLGFGAVTPHDTIGFGKGNDFVDPFTQRG
jgi:AcrR family transcriptional regulator